MENERQHSGTVNAFRKSCALLETIRVVEVYVTCEKWMVLHRYTVKKCNPRARPFRLGRPGFGLVSPLIGFAEGHECLRPRSHKHHFI
jgi:hypothetical protein